MATSGALRAFRHRNFAILFPANLVSNIGSWAQRVAQDWLVLQLTHSASALGLVTALQFLPSLLLSTWAGLLADRFPKRGLLLLTNAGAGLSSLVLGVLIVSNQVRLWHVFVLAFTLGIFNAIDAPIRQSFNAELVGTDDLPSAVSLNSANFNTGRLVGPAISGFLIQAFDTGPSFLINAASYLFVILALLLMRPAQLLGVKTAPAGSKIRDAYRYVLGRPDLFWVMIAVFATATFGVNFQIFIALMATQEFHRSAGDFGLLGTALAVGSLSGALLSTRLERHRTPIKITMVMMVFGATLVVLAFAPSYLAFAFMLPCSGVLALIALISANSYVQTSTDDTLRGRVMGIYLTLMLGGTPLGSMLLGVVAQQTNIRVAIWFCGTVTIGFAILAFSRLRRFE
mgnify:CR=1 FL=1